MGEGLRKIVVEGRRFRWRFNDRIVVVPEGRSGPPLYVDWGWEDCLEAGGRGPGPVIVTPRFVAEAIAFALASGWQPDGHRRPFRLDYKDPVFRVREGEI
jgi:hypothetical protein